MARYIDADELLEVLNEELMYECLMFSQEQVKYLRRGLRIAINDVKRFPTEDVVPKSEIKCAYAYDGEVEEFCAQSPCGNYKMVKQIKSEVDDLRRYIILNEDIAIKCKRENGEQNEEYWKGKISAFKQIRAYIDAELKNKYTESEDK